MEKQYYRVTEVLRPFSGLDYVDKNVLENAAIRGTKVHALCASLMEGIGVPDIPEELAGYVRSFELWAEDKNFLPRLPRLYCEELRLTGESDGVYQIEQTDRSALIILFDLKTPSKESKTWALQLSAYHYLARKNGHRIDRVETVRLKKDGSGVLARQYDPVEYFPVFKSALTCYQHFHPKAGPTAGSQQKKYGV